jgi:hypothetical protein
MAASTSPEPVANREDDGAIIASVNLPDERDIRDFDEYASAELKRRAERTILMVMRARQQA